MKVRLIAIMKHKNSKRVSAATCISLLLVALCTMASCAVVQLPSKRSTKSSDSAASTVSSASSDIIAFTEMTYKGSDTNVVGAPGLDITYTTSDQAFMNRVWKTMKMADWTQTAAYNSVAEVDITLHFTGGKPGWYVLSPDNKGYYSSGTGTKLSTRSPLDYSEDTDTSYTLPSNVYDAVAKLLQDYTSAHPPQTDLDEILKSVLYDKGTFVQYQSIEEFACDFTTSQFGDPFMKAFGDLTKWEKIDNGKIKDFTGSNQIGIHTDIGIDTCFSLDKNLVSISNQGVQSVYQVPPDVMSNTVKIVKELALQKSSR